MLEPAHGDTRHISSLHNSAICGDHIIAMRRVLPVLLMLGVAACAPPMRWERPGATDEMVSLDMTSCRQAAQQEAMRSYSFGYYPFAFGPPVWGMRRNWMLWQMRADSDRFFAENRLTSFCMRNKGYEQVEVRQAPETQAPQAPPSPSPEPTPR